MRYVGDPALPGIPVTINTSGSPLAVIPQLLTSGGYRPQLGTSDAFAGTAGAVVVTNAVASTNGTSAYPDGSTQMAFVNSGLGDIAGTGVTHAAVPVFFSGMLDQTDSSRAGHPRIGFDTVLLPAGSAIPPTTGGTCAGYQGVAPIVSVNPTPNSNYTGIVYAPLSGVQNDPTSATAGISLAVGVVGGGNAFQYLGGQSAADFTNPTNTVGQVRGVAGTDGVSTILGITSALAVAAPVTLVDSKNVSVPSESDGKLKLSMYGSGGSNSLSIGSDGSISKIAQLAEITSAVTSVVNTTGGAPIAAYITDSSGVSVGTFNGGLSVALQDRSGTAVTMVPQTVGTSSALAVLTTTSATSSDDVAIAVSEWVGVKNDQKTASAL